MTPDRTPEKRKPLTWAEVPDAEKARLRDREAAQRRETKKRGLPALPVSVEGLWLVQRGMCTCNECRGEVPLVVGKIVIAHPHFRAGKGSPGHVPTNVSLWLEQCNKREAGPETTAMWKGRRFEPDLTRTKAKAKPKGSFRKPPKNYVSPLSKEGRAKMKRKMR